MKRKTFYFGLLIIFLLIGLVACNLPNSNQSPQIVLVTRDPNIPTPTPFLPSSYVVDNNQPDPAVTPVPDDTNPGNPLPTPSEERPFGQKLILILGSDWRPNSGYRTDVILLMAVNPYDGTVKMLSFPRDLYIEIPYYGYERINVVQQLGGFDLTASTFEYNFGVRPDYYVMTNFQGFTYIVDALGGITVNVRQTLTDECKLPMAVNKTCTIPAGYQWMDGETALWYVRSRHSSSDFDRERRSQEVLEALFFKLMNLNAVLRAPELYNLFSSSVETNLALQDVIGLLGIAPTIVSDPGRVTATTITANDVYNYITPNGAMVLLPDYAAIQALIYQTVYEP